MKKLLLSSGTNFALVDDEDYKELSKINWRLAKAPHTNYATSKGVAMHRFILNAKRGQKVDHINRNGLDNRRSNLRFCTDSQNKANSNLYKNNKSGYPGVYWDNKKQRWVIVVYFNKKAVFKTSRASKSDAINTARIKRKEIFGEYCGYA